MICLAKEEGISPVDCWIMMIHMAFFKPLSPVIQSYTWRDCDRAGNAMGYRYASDQELEIEERKERPGKADSNGTTVQKVRLRKKNSSFLMREPMGLVIHSAVCTEQQVLPGAPGHGNCSLGNSCIRLSCRHQLRASRGPASGLSREFRVLGETGMRLEMLGGTAAALLLWQIKDSLVLKGSFIPQGKPSTKRIGIVLLRAREISEMPELLLSHDGSQSSGALPQSPLRVGCGEHGLGCWPTLSNAEPPNSLTVMGNCDRSVIHTPRDAQPKPG
ncbi:hypothetical protein EK904_012008 [Melospiza melodia maxima]|nr:hypothetical protein EK904_012008 [Melospiza melodia maxima]